MPHLNVHLETRKREAYLPVAANGADSVVPEAAAVLQLGIILVGIPSALAVVVPAPL